MKWKSTLVLLLAAVAIGAYISLYELRQPLPQEREQRAKRVLDVTAQDVTQIVLDLPQAKGTFTRQGALWKLAPKGVRADPERLGELLGSASPLMAERVLSGTRERPLDLKSFGLDPALGWISLATSSRALTLLFGDTTAVHDNRYAKLADRPDVFIISSSLFDSLNQPLEMFRDPALLHVSGWLVDELAITRSSGTVALTRHENAWRLTQPLADQADRTEATALLNALSQVRIKRFVDDAPAVERLAEWGLDHPKAEVRLRQQGSSASTTTTIFFGAPLADDRTLIYAKRSDEPSLYAVAAADVDPLLKDPNELRARACFELFTDSVTKVAIVHESANWTIERANGQWKESGATTTLDATRVGDFLNRFSDLRVSGFVDDASSDLSRYGLNTPTGSVAIWSTDPEKPQRLFIGATVPESSERYGRIEGRDVLVKLPGLVTELLATTPASLSAPRSSAEPAGSAAPPSGG